MSQQPYFVPPSSYLISDGSTQALQELALLLKPEDAIHYPEAISLDAWMQRAQQQDVELGIDRHCIPCLPIHLPPRRRTLDFFQLAKAIGETAQLPSPPRNFEQVCWFKTLHYYRQARGVALAQRIIPGVIADPLESRFSRHLPKQSVYNLKVETEIDLARYRLLEAGEPLIRAWAAAENLSYPFDSATDLLVEILREEFQISWKIGPLNPDYQWLTTNMQKGNFLGLVGLLSQEDWDENRDEEKNNKTPQSRFIPTKQLPYQEAKEDYLQFLREIGWSGYWILALRAFSSLTDSNSLGEQYLNQRRSLPPLWDNYIKAMRGLRRGKDIFIDELNWRDGTPYKACSTSRTRRVEAYIDPQGYIHWVWASSSP